MERRDAMIVLQASMISMACLVSNPRVNPDAASKMVLGKKKLLSEVAFPYIKTQDQDVHSDSEGQDIDAYFDELDEIVKSRNATESNTEAVNDETEARQSHIGVQDSK